MGATTFIVTWKGDTPKTAFDAAVQEYREMYGSCYSGTIAQKNNFTVIKRPKSANNTNDIVEYAQKLIDDEDPRINDKWGPAGCIEIANGLYLFFGWASS